MRLTNIKGVIPLLVEQRHPLFQYEQCAASLRQQADLLFKGQAAEQVSYIWSREGVDHSCGWGVNG
jgi:hypothetical protein